MKKLITHLEAPEKVKFTGNQHPVYKINKHGVVVLFTKLNWGRMVHSPKGHGVMFTLKRYQEENFEVLKGRVILEN